MWVRTPLCKLQKRGAKKEYTQLAVASDKVYQLLAHGWWFSPASSTPKTGHHDIAEKLLKEALNTINQIERDTSDMSFPITKPITKRLKLSFYFHEYY